MIVPEGVVKSPIVMIINQQRMQHDDGMFDNNSDIVSNTSTVPQLDHSDSYSESAQSTGPPDSDQDSEVLSSMSSDSGDAQNIVNGAIPPMHNFILIRPSPDPAGPYILMPRLGHNHQIARHLSANREIRFTPPSPWLFLDNLQNGVLGEHILRDCKLQIYTLSNPREGEDAVIFIRIEIEPGVTRYMAGPIDFVAYHRLEEYHPSEIPHFPPAASVIFRKMYFRFYTVKEVRVQKVQVAELYVYLRVVDMDGFTRVLRGHDLRMFENLMNTDGLRTMNGHPLPLGAMEDGNRLHVENAEYDMKQLANLGRNFSIVVQNQQPPWVENGHGENSTYVRG